MQGRRQRAPNPRVLVQVQLSNIILPKNDIQEQPPPSTQPAAHPTLSTSINKNKIPFEPASRSPDVRHNRQRPARRRTRPPPAAAASDAAAEDAARSAVARAVVGASPEAHASSLPLPRASTPANAGPQPRYGDASCSPAGDKHVVGPSQAKTPPNEPPGGFVGGRRARGGREGGADGRAAPSGHGRAEGVAPSGGAAVAVAAAAAAVAVGARRSRGQQGLGGS